MEKKEFIWSKANDISKRFTFKRKLSETLQGRIYSGTDTTTKMDVVIKEAWKSLIERKISRSKNRVEENFEQEVRLMTYISNKKDCCQYICKSLANWEEKDAFYCVLEKCDIGLFEFIKSFFNENKINLKKTDNTHFLKKPNKWILTVGKIFYEIVCGVNWLHNIGICHLDLSLENIMLVKRKDGYIPKIIDFGVSAMFDDGNKDCLYQKKCGKLSYMAGEVFAGKMYDARAADIYTLGVMLFMMLTGAPPYSLPRTRDALYDMIMKGKMILIIENWKFTSRMTENAYDLIDRILKPENKRIKMIDILQHPFMKQFSNVGNNNNNNNNDNGDNDDGYDDMKKHIDENDEDGNNNNNNNNNNNDNDNNDNDNDNNGNDSDWNFD